MLYLSEFTTKTLKIINFNKKKLIRHNQFSIILLNIKYINHKPYSNIDPK